MIIIPGVITWLKLATTRPVIWADQDGPAPELPFVTAKVATVAHLGHSHAGNPNAQGKFIITQQAEFTVNINVYGDDALARTIRNSLEKPSVHHALNATDLAFVDVLSGPNDVAAIFGTGWEARTAFDVRLRGWVEIQDTVDVIEHVEMTSTLNDGVPVTQIVNPQEA